MMRRVICGILTLLLRDLKRLKQYTLVGTL
jgi:hypothetical protein